MCSMCTISSERVEPFLSSDGNRVSLSTFRATQLGCPLKHFLFFVVIPMKDIFENTFVLGAERHTQARSDQDAESGRDAPNALPGI